MIEILNRPEFLVILFFLSLGFILLGRIYRLNLQKKHPNDLDGLGPIEAVIFSLFGLILAFTFSGSWTRFEERKEIVTAEANALRTAYFRLDLLSDEVQPKMRQLFKEYTSIRADIYQNTSEEMILKAEYARGVELRDQMWDLAVFDVRRSGGTSSGSLILAALNRISDVVASQTMASKNHPPAIIYIMLIILNLFCGFLIGYNMAHKNGRWLYVISYSAIISSLLYLVIEIELPRHGLITVHEADQFIIDLRDSM